MQNGRKAVWSIPYVSVALFPSLKRNFIAYRSSKVSDCIFEIHQQWQSGFSRVYFNCYCSCSFDPEIIKICQSSHKIYSNNILNFQGSTIILNAYTKKVWKLIEAPFVVTTKWVWTTFVQFNPHVILIAQNSFPLSLSQWFIDRGRSSRLHLVSAQSWCIFAGRSALVCSCIGVHKKMLLMIFIL